MKNNSSPLEVQFNEFLKISDTGKLVKCLSGLDRKDLIPLFDHLPRFIKGKLLIAHEETLALQDKEIVQYAFATIKEKLNFLKGLESRISGLIEIYQLSKVNPENLNSDRINTLLTDLQFIYVTEGGNNPEILKAI